MSRTYFTDRDLGKQFPRILADAGIPVQRHGDVFAPDGTDEQWLEHCGTQRLVAITHNSRIRYVPNELAALQRYNVVLVVVVGKAPTAELARNFVSTHRGHAGSAGGSFDLEDLPADTVGTGKSA